MNLRKYAMINTRVDDVFGIHSLILCSYVGAKAVDFGGSENGRFAKLNAKKGFSPSEDFDGQNANGKTKGRTMTQDVRMGVK